MPWEHRASSTEGLPSPAAPQLADTRLSIPFVLSDFPLTLFFSSWSFLPLGPLFSLTLLVAPLVLRGQPGSFWSPADPSNIPFVSALLQTVLRELLVKWVTSPLLVMQKIPSFPLLSRLLAFASQVVRAAVGKGGCNFPGSGEMLLFYSHNFKAAGSKAGTASAWLSPAPPRRIQPPRRLQPWGTPLKMWKCCGRQNQTLKSGQGMQFVKACLFLIEKENQTP